MRYTLLHAKPEYFLHFRQTTALADEPNHNNGAAGFLCMMFVVVLAGFFLAIFSMTQAGLFFTKVGLVH